MPQDSSGREIFVGDRVSWRGEPYTIKAFGEANGRHGTRSIVFEEPVHVQGEVPDEIGVDLVEKAPSRAPGRCRWCSGNCPRWGEETCPLRPRQIPRFESPALWRDPATLRILVRGGGDDIALVTTNLASLRRRRNIAAEIEARDEGAKITFQGDLLHYHVFHVFLPQLTPAQIALLDRNAFLVLDGTIDLPSILTKFPAKSPRVHVLPDGVVWWTAPEYSASTSGTFETHSIQIADLEDRSRTRKEP